MTKEDKLKLMCTLLVPFSEHAAKTYASEEAFDDYARGAIEKVDRILERAADRCGVRFTDDEPPTSHEIYQEIERQAIRSVEQREEKQVGVAVDKSNLADTVVEAFYACEGARLPIRRCSLCGTFLALVSTPAPDSGYFLSFDTSCGCGSSSGPHLTALEPHNGTSVTHELVSKFSEPLQKRLLTLLRKPHQNMSEWEQLQHELCMHLIGNGHD